MDLTLKGRCEEMVGAVDRFMDELAFSKALQAIWDVISACNKYIDDAAPWVLAKDPAQKVRLETVMYCLMESQRLVHFVLSAFMPATAAKALASLGWSGEVTKEGLVWGGLQNGTTVTKAEALFPRIEA
jgi:methionyl-tRNA synthetase